jgi:hypothetical protein
VVLFIRQPGEHAHVFVALRLADLFPESASRCRKPATRDRAAWRVVLYPAKDLVADLRASHQKATFWPVNRQSLDIPDISRSVPTASTAGSRASGRSAGGIPRT